MNISPNMQVHETPAQELVDTYAAHTKGFESAVMTDTQIANASIAAYRLERRGYVEQAGIWLHDSLPPITALAHG